MEAATTSIQRNHIHNVCFDPTYDSLYPKSIPRRNHANQCHGIYFTGDFNIIEFNEIHATYHPSIPQWGGWAIQFYSGTTSTNIVRFNKLYDFHHGIVLSGGPGSVNNQAYGNKIYNGLSGAVCITNVDGTGHKIYNNTCYNTSGGIDGSGSAGLIVRNNIFSNVGTPIAGSYTTGPNICNSLTTGCEISASATTLFGGDLTNFTLATGSPAINAGTASIGGGVTILACPQPTGILCYNGSTPDIGAVESGTVVVVRACCGGDNSIRTLL